MTPKYLVFAPSTLDSIHRLDNTGTCFSSQDWSTTEMTERSMLAIFGIILKWGD